MTADEQAKKYSNAFRKMRESIERTQFILLDHQPEEERSSRSWEVEREDFVRQQEKHDG